MSKIQPLGDQVLIKPLDANENSFGFIVTDKKPPIEGIVMSNYHAELSPNDKVIFNKYAGTELNHEGVDYVLVDIKDVIAKYDV